MPPTLSFTRRTLGPLALLLLSPPLALSLWLIVARYDGSVLAFLSGLTPYRLLHELPRPSLWAVGLLAGWTALQWALLVALPGPVHHGPVTASGARPAYRRNGVLAWGVTHALLVGGFVSGGLSGSVFFAHYGELLVTLTLLAYVLCVGLYVKALCAPNSPDRVRTGHLLFDYFQGIELHPTVFGTSLKQLVNCRISMMGWSAIVVAFCAHQIESLGRLTPALLVSSALLLVYLFKFFVWETGYFASLDVMHDRFGYYICWGVLAWVPAVYPCAQFYLAAHPQELSWLAAAACGVGGLLAIAVNYAADAQRQRVRQSGRDCRVWGAAPRVITATYRGSDGLERENLLLVSGYWGLSRHFHYLPEIGLALFWTIPAGLSLVTPSFYVIFLGLLLWDRSGRDDKRCAAKYGSAWAAYQKLVPYRIVPHVY